MTDRVLADFRAWVGELLEPTPVADEEPPAVDLHTLVAAFTALRHDVTLSTKATRAAVEALKPADPVDVIAPLAKVIVDVADALATAKRQVDALLKAPVPPPIRVPAPPAGGFLARMTGVAAALGGWHATAEAAVTERQADDLARRAAQLAGLADGYAISLRRIERALPAFGLEPFDTAGKPFDPELMEVVEAVAGDQPSGTVAEEVRRGYRRAGAVFRFAQVKVVR